MDNRKVNSYGIVGSIYANYIIQSIALIVIMQFSLDLFTQLNADLVDLGYIASGIGIGKISLMFIGGLLSDKFGRKLFILLGMSCYAIFFIGMTFCTNIHVAFCLAVAVGAGNSFLDTGSMPALTECFPNSAGSASVLIKAFISIGSLVLPFIVTFFHSNHIWYGWAFWGFTFYLLINCLLILPQKFPHKDTAIKGSKGSGDYFKATPRFEIEGILLTLMGFTTTATFVVILQWLPTIAMKSVNMSDDDANLLISCYSTASIISVFATAFIVKRFLKPIFCIIILPALSAIVLILFYFNISPLMCLIAAIGMGFTAAGGVLQLTLVVMQQMFPTRKGLAVGCMYTFSGLTFVVIPRIVPKLAMTNVSYAILLDFFIAILSVILGSIVFYRFKKVIDINKI
ncbi:MULTISPECIES: MFS transporter [unclassified Gilliamella]|uniref:MFS transporter n=1 Tax=unclassified Gilliamella TaxID=2685620 RepID=UPI00226ACAEA|nr:MULTISPECIES: MFS transporter [unclassified Gilliamella]MCX8601999.1 MFS transporter [Gilliamella sp. B3722]MCX8607931.1 MFS transporter [Gilliamella sp. B3771]MCX8611268.1 MFS transporter [Gilliamella sp. B3891]MCX8613840.1 MFS transporter [Gilliamella sp. B3773]MCX8616052.1 MFS transporter [Gilliamella sp. B3770]